MFRTPSISMRSSLIVTIMTMGILSILYSTLTANFFQEYILENGQETLVNLAELEVHNLGDNAITETVNLGMSVQSGKELRSAIKSRKRINITSILDQHFHRAFVTLGILDLEKLIVYDKNLNFLYASSEGIESISADEICTGILQEMKQRKGSNILKPFSRMCTLNEKLHLISIVPVGGLRLTGYLAVVVNPLKNLIKAEEGIDLPLKVESMNNQVLYESKNWPKKNAMSNVLIVRYDYKAGNPQPIASFLFSFDLVKLKQRLDKTRRNILIIVTVLTVFVVLLTLYVFQKYILYPLNKLAFYLRMVKKDKNYLGKEIKVRGSKEIIELANDFNEMTHELKRLYSKLEDMAFTDSLTGIPNRAQLLDRMQHYIVLSQRKNSKINFIFMLMDLNRFKQVNDTYGHNVGDGLLQEVASRIKSATRDSDTVARLGGDEFAVLLSGASDGEIAIELAKNITKLLSEPIIIDGHTLDIGISIGISRYPEDGDTTKRITSCADKAMYHAKNNNLPYSVYKED